MHLVVDALVSLYRPHGMDINGTLLAANMGNVRSCSE